MRVKKQTLEKIGEMLYLEVPEESHERIREYEKAVANERYREALFEALKLTSMLSWQPSAKLAMMIHELRRQILDSSVLDI